MISVLKEKYLMDHEDAEMLSSFLMPMMHYYPDTRATAAELVKHPWLDGVVVQGEVEMRMDTSRIADTDDGQGQGRGREGVGLDEVTRLGPPVAGMVGMGRI